MTTFDSAETKRLPLNVRMVISGLVFVLLGLIAGARQQRTGAWPKVNGQVTQSIRGGIRLAGWYTFTVTYSFSVDGRKYTVLEPIWARRSPEHRAVPLGVPVPAENSQVPISYNPTRPSEATIDPGLKPWPFAVGGLGVLLVGMALVMKLFPRAAEAEALTAGTVAPY